MIASNIVEKNFSRNPDYYHKYAGTQLHVADKLAALIPDRQYKNILEIGCGTGFLTEKLFQKYPGARFTITDISPTMLDFCRIQTCKRYLDQGIVTEFFVHDIANSCPSGQFDLIISSLAFQWIVDLQGTIKQLKRNLLSEGILCFSTLTKGTFESLKKIFTEAGVKFPGPTLLTAEEIQSACSYLADIKITNEKRLEKFDSILMLLRHIQGTGAGNASSLPLPAADLKKVLTRDTQGIDAEYFISYIFGKSH